MWDVKVLDRVPMRPAIDPSGEKVLIYVPENVLIKGKKIKFTVQEFLKINSIFQNMEVPESIGNTLLKTGWIFIEKKMINSTLRNNAEASQEKDYAYTPDNVIRELIINLFVFTFGETGDLSLVQPST